MKPIWLALLIFWSPIGLGSSPQPSSSPDPKIPFIKYQLENGLEVILHQDDRIPLVAVDVWYHVGAGDEVPGKSGFAHLFEHMLFQGSKHVGEDRHFEVLRNVGASLVNGTTNFDRTNYFEVVPSNQLETALWLESDRMGFLLPLLNQASLDNQIEVVRNEKRQRVDNTPYGVTRETLFQMLYPKGHPYHNQIIGDHQHLAQSTLQDVVSFYKKWYTPANATLVLAGDFELEATKEMVEKWFGSIPSSPKQPRQQVDMPQRKRNRKVVVDKFAKLRRLDYAWNVPGRFSPEEPALDLLASHLNSVTGPLHTKLVRDLQLAHEIQAYYWGSHHSGIFSVAVTLKGDAAIKKTEAALEKELEKSLTTLIGKKSLQRRLTQVESDQIWHLEHLISRAEILQTYNHYKGDPGYLQADLQRYRDVDAKAIQKAAAKYLGKSSRQEILTLPVPKPAVAGKLKKGGAL